MRRHELTDEQWQVIQPLLPVSGAKGGRGMVPVQESAEAIDELDREVPVDSSIVRAHQHAAGARRVAVSHRGRADPCGGQSEPGDHAIGRAIHSYLRRRHIPATNIVERCFNRLKQFRAIATRFDKTATSYRCLIDLAAAEQLTELGWY
ncbi:hypothetical protein [Amycolatopsis sp. NPDC004625]|uniref:hypothetical protein n=1 Tax=Amycolatopsis sp. NPDC004625 TaxID=3154670 RepID=UPI0033A0A246